MDSMANILQNGEYSEQLNIGILSCISSVSQVTKLSEKGLAVL